MKKTIALFFTAAAGFGLLSGCAGQKQVPVKSGYLSHYHHLTQVDDTTWRYVNASRLAAYTQFRVSSVDVLVKNYNGQPITPELKKRMTDFLRTSITASLQDKYPVVTVPSAQTADIRVAITDAYKSGNQLGITVEGEIEDSYSSVQVAAVMRSDLGEVYLGDWWDNTSAREIVDGWAKRLRQVIDSAQAR